MLYIKAKFEKLEYTKNRSKLIFSSTEKVPDLEFIQLHKKEGFLIFNPDHLRAEVLEIVKDRKIGVDDLGVTPSEKLRKTLFLVAQARGLENEFNDFYKEEMNRICSHYQAKYL